MAPYATGLAAMIDPAAAIRNFDRLQKLGARGRFGWYEALDFSPADFAAAPAYTASATPLPADETIRIAVYRR